MNNKIFTCEECKKVITNQRKEGYYCGKIVCNRCYYKLRNKWSEKGNPKWIIN